MKLLQFIKTPLRMTIYTVIMFFLMIAIAVAGCIVPSGTVAMLATPNGMTKVFAQVDVNVNIEQEQPPAEILKQFSQNAGEDWTDAVVVTDENGYHLLVHRGDLNCGDKQPKNQ